MQTGLAIFASDNISSSAYATEEVMRVLVLAGVGALALTMPITIGWERSSVPAAASELSGEAPAKVRRRPASLRS